MPPPVRAALSSPGAHATLFECQTVHTGSSLRSIPYVRLVKFHEGQWWGHQDLYVVLREESRSRPSIVRLVPNPGIYSGPRNVYPG